MSLKSHISELARNIANQSFRSVTSNNLKVIGNAPTLAKVLSTIDGQYIVLLPSGETKTVKASGNRPISIGNTYHIIGGTIF